MIDLERYRLPADGRKWKSVCDERHRIMAHIAAGGDCTPDALGLAQRTFLRRMAELRQLGMVADQLSTAKFARPPDSPPDSGKDRQIRVPDSVNVTEDRQIEAECGGKPPDSPPDSPDSPPDSGATGQIEGGNRTNVRGNRTNVKGQPDECGTGRIGNSHINTGESANLGLLPAIYPPLDPPPYPPPVASKDLVPDSPLLPKPEEEGGGGDSLGLRPCAQGENSETSTPNRNKENLALNTDLARTRNKENLGGRLVEIYAKHLGVLNMAGFKKVQALHGTVEEKCKTFEYWLLNRDIAGLNCPLAMFSIEYPAYRDDLKRYEKRKASKAANDKKVAESHAAVAQWRADFESVKFEGDPSTWAQQAEDWVTAHPYPPYLVVTEDGELAKVDWRADKIVGLHVTRARDQHEEYLRRTTHSPDDFFCACEGCQADFWAEKDKGPDLSAFGFESAASA